MFGALWRWFWWGSGESDVSIDPPVIALRGTHSAYSLSGENSGTVSLIGYDTAVVAITGERG